jgi:hypothetical protein
MGISTLPYLPSSYYFDQGAPPNPKKCYYKTIALIRENIPAANAKYHV